MKSCVFKIQTKTLKLRPFLDKTKEYLDFIYCFNVYIFLELCPTLDRSDLLATVYL